MDTITLEGGVTLQNVHTRGKCRVTPCWVHSPSQHGLSSAPRHWRSDRGLLERICPHGIGHPDPDQPLADHEFVHGCDGCCYETSVAGGPID